MSLDAQKIRELLARGAYVTDVQIEYTWRKDEITAIELEFSDGVFVRINAVADFCPECNEDAAAIMDIVQVRGAG